MLAASCMCGVIARVASHGAMLSHMGDFKLPDSAGASLGGMPTCHLAHQNANLNRTQHALMQDECRLNPPNSRQPASCCKRAQDTLVHSFRH